MIKNLFLTFFEVSVSTSLIVLVLILLSSFLNKRYAAKWNYWIWVVLAIHLIIPFRWSLPVQQIVIDIPVQMTNPMTPNTNTPKMIPNAHTSVQTAMPNTNISDPVIPQQPQKSHINITLLDIISMIWFLGSLIFLFWNLFCSFYYKKQIMKKGIAIESDSVLPLLLYLKKELRIKHKISVIEYSQAASPMMIGFFSSVLVLPEKEYSQEELFFILKHELIHVKRHDIYVKLLLLIANALHWWNPFIYIMQREAVVDMELSCDEKVIEGADYAVRKAYTETLFATLHKQYKKKTILSTQFYGGIQVMKKRFKNILLWTKKRNGVSLFVFVSIITLTLGTFIGCSLSESNAGEPVLTSNVGGEEKESEQDQKPEEELGQEEKDEKQKELDSEEKARKAAYHSVLENLYLNHVFPDGKEYGFEDTFYDISENQFAVYDIDQDGKEELIIQYTTTIMAGMINIIYDFDQKSGTVREEFSEFPSLTFYNNGIIQADWSHNHGMAASLEEFWPYTLYQYDKETDTYRTVGMVDAWDKSYHEKDSSGNSFPEEMDIDGDGILYYIMLDGTYEFHTPFDLEEYNQWRNSYVNGAEKIDIPFVNLTKENIDSVQ